MIGMGCGDGDSESEVRGRPNWFYRDSSAAFWSKNKKRGQAVGRTLIDNFYKYSMERTSFLW